MLLMFNPNGIKTLLANVLITFPIKGNTDLNDGPKSLRIHIIILFYATEFLIILY